MLGVNYQFGYCKFPSLKIYFDFIISTAAGAFKSPPLVEIISVDIICIVST
jgi:hypothetical protein